MIWFCDTESGVLERVYRSPKATTPRRCRAKARWLKMIETRHVKETESRPSIASPGSRVATSASWIVRNIVVHCSPGPVSNEKEKDASPTYHKEHDAIADKGPAQRYRGCARAVERVHADAYKHDKFKRKRRRSGGHHPPAHAGDNADVKERIPNHAR
jgi:hypothetical protein